MRFSPTAAGFAAVTRSCLLAKMRMGTPFSFSSSKSSVSSWRPWDLGKNNVYLASLLKARLVSAVNNIHLRINTKQTYRIPKCLCCHNSSSNKAEFCADLKCSKTCNHEANLQYPKHSAWIQRTVQTWCWTPENELDRPPPEPALA